MLNKVEAAQISFCYGSEAVLQGVSFSIAGGDFAALVGPNGAGKSTLMRILLGELHPSEGNISLLGEDIRTFNRWREVGYVPQSSAIKSSGFPATVEEIIAASLYDKSRASRLSARERRKKAANALSQVGMDGCEKKLMGSLSGGQQQRVMLARALVTEPKLMLLDEPATGVDGKSVEMLYELLAKLNRETGLTILMITHDTSRALEYVSRIFCLEHCTMLELSKDQVHEELCHKHSH